MSSIHNKKCSLETPRAPGGAADRCPRRRSAEPTAAASLPAEPTAYWPALTQVAGWIGTQVVDMPGMGVVMPTEEASSASATG